jgi:dihydrofolate reductase
MKIAVIAAIGQRGELGVNGNLPWKIKEDLQHFKRVTMGQTVVMGRKTYESLPVKLEGRNIIVMTTQEGYVAEGALVMHSVAEVVKYAYENELETLYVAGGGEAYKHFLPLAKQLYLTRVHATFDDADAFFPRFWLENWEMKTFNFNFNEQYSYQFEYYERTES